MSRTFCSAIGGSAQPSRAVGDMMTSVLIKRMEYRGVMMAHGSRAIARTNLAERLDYPEAMVEMQLFHLPRDAHGRAYNRVEWRPERLLMMQKWSEWLDEVRSG